jgi:hypothetical protein
MRKLTVYYLLFFLPIFCSSQAVQLSGYVFEENNRGYLPGVTITIFDSLSGKSSLNLTTDAEGKFTCNLPIDHEFSVTAALPNFFRKEAKFSSKGMTAGTRHFMKMEMKREPGYLLEATMSEKSQKIGQQVDAITGADILIWNHTTELHELKLHKHPEPAFSFTLKKGNHYSVRISKTGYQTKQIEFFVNVRGCILCVEGVKNVGPGIAENLTNGLEMGTLVANIEIERDSSVVPPLTDLALPKEKTPVEVTENQTVAAPIQPATAQTETPVLPFVSADSTAAEPTISDPNFRGVEIATELSDGSRTMGGNFTGYRVELLQSAMRLPPGHEIFARLPHLLEEYLPQGRFGYLVGDFPDLEIASWLIDNVIRKDFPDATLVQYANGLRVE